MKNPTAAKRSLVGTWRIVAMELWKAHDLDLLGPAQQESVGDEHRATTVVVDDPSWLNGPPYAVVEVVFDEDDLADCYRTEADLHATQGD